ncbi:MAG TPA: PH domain-containing protein [Gemmatimonas sp.]|uniref:PH domain-containing protein n=1 Tax=Gemmatimonas sp. TaxID=1962908 RepID=UPI002EDA1D45
METIRFQSRIDLWLVVVVMVPLVAALAALGTRMQQGITKGLVLSTLMMLLALLGSMWLFVDTSYAATADELRIRSGPFRESVPLALLQRIRPTNRLDAAPALSLHRLELQYGAGRVAIISPRQRDEFIATLTRMAPHVVVESV